MFLFSKLLLLGLFVIFLHGCSYISPEWVVKQRYHNMGLNREVKTIYRTENVAVITGSMETKKCKEVEVLALNKFNEDKEWRIVKLHNERDCDLNATNKLKERFKAWKNRKDIK